VQRSKPASPRTGGSSSATPAAWRAETILKNLVDRRAKGEYIDPFVTATDGPAIHDQSRRSSSPLVL